MLDLPAQTATAAKDSADAHIATTKHSIPGIADRKKVSLRSWKKANISSPENILK